MSRPENRDRVAGDARGILGAERLAPGGTYGPTVTDPLYALAAEAAAAYPGGRPYDYAAVDALSARILVVEEGGKAFPDGTGVGSPEDVAAHPLWNDILDRAGYQPGMYSWWNAIPCGLLRDHTADDRARGGKYARRAVDLHTQLEVVITVGEAKNIVKTAPRLTPVRSPHRATHRQRDEIVEALVEARRYAYPLGF